MVTQMGASPAERPAVPLFSTYRRSNRSFRPIIPGDYTPVVAIIVEEGGHLRSLIHANHATNDGAVPRFECLVGTAVKHCRGRFENGRTVGLRPVAHDGVDRVLRSPYFAGGCERLRAI